MKMTLVAIRLSKREHEIARELGAGNVSAGIREALIAYWTWRNTLHNSSLSDKTC